MIKFLRKIFSKRVHASEQIVPASQNMVSPIRVTFDDAGVSLFYQGERKNHIKWCEIDLIAICIEDDFLPSPYWYVGHEDNLLRIPNDAENGSELFFDGFKQYIDGYGSDDNFKTIIEAQGAMEGSFVIWKADGVETA